MIRTITLAAVAATGFAAAPALADGHAATGDAVAGEGAFRQCQSCHVVESPDGETSWRAANAKTGPNLYGVAGRDGYGARRRTSTIRTSSIVRERARLDLRRSRVRSPTCRTRPATCSEVTGESWSRQDVLQGPRGKRDAVNLYAFLAQFGDEGQLRPGGR